MRPSRFLAVCGLLITLISAGCVRNSPRSALSPAGTAIPIPQQVVSTRDPAPPQVLRYTLAPLPEPVDPQWNCQPQLGVLLGTVYETLVYLNEDYIFEPSLAASWETSADGTSYTFQLHPRVKFHDGTLLTAESVRRNLDRIAAGPSRLLPGYLGTDELDENTVRVRFDRPYPTFLYQLSTVCMAMLLPAAFGNDGRLQGTLPAGTGPFQVSAGEEAAGGMLTLVRNEKYEWGPASYKPNVVRGLIESGEDQDSPCRTGDWVRDHAGLAFLKTIILQFLPDAVQRAAALETGQADAAEDLSLADAERLQRTGRFWVFTVPLPTPDDATTDRETFRRRRITIQALAPSEVRASPDPPSVVFNAQRREVNCLSYGVHAWNTSLYDTSIRGIP